MYELLNEDTDEEEDDELVPRVKYSVILQKEEYEDDDEEEDPLPYVDIGPGYYFFDSPTDARIPTGSTTQSIFFLKIK
jgi:hypothetical protein